MDVRRFSGFWLLKRMFRVNFPGNWMLGTLSCRISNTKREQRLWNRKNTLYTSVLSRVSNFAIHEMISMKQRLRIWELTDENKLIVVVCRICLIIKYRLGIYRLCVEKFVKPALLFLLIAYLWPAWQCRVTGFLYRKEVYKKAVLDCSVSLKHLMEPRHFYSIDIHFQDL